MSPTVTSITMYLEVLISAESKARRRKPGDIVWIYGKQNRIMSLFIRHHKAVRQFSMMFDSIVPPSSSHVEPPASK